VRAIEVVCFYLVYGVFIHVGSVSCTIHCYCNIDTANAADAADAAVVSIAADAAFITMVFILLLSHVVDFRGG